MKGIAGKRVVVTAGGQGIGKAITKAYLLLGAKVAICDIAQSGLDNMQTEHPEVLTFKADVSSQKEIGTFFDRVEEKFGGVDILINNAGIAGPTGVIEDLELADWKRCIEVDIDGIFLACKRCLPFMKQQRYGSIINISSTAGLCAFAGRAPYAAAKWAIIGISKTLAVETGSYGIRVNAIAPGSINNARMDGVIEREAIRLGVSQQSIRETYIKQTAMQTFIDPEEIADSVIFFTSDLGRNISGQVLAVDGYAETLMTF